MVTRCRVKDPTTRTSEENRLGPATRPERSHGFHPIERKVWGQNCEVWDKEIDRRLYLESSKVADVLSGHDVVDRKVEKTAHERHSGSHGVVQHPCEASLLGISWEEASWVGRDVMPRANMNEVREIAAVRVKALALPARQPSRLVRLPVVPDDASEHWTVGDGLTEERGVVVNSVPVVHGDGHVVGAELLPRRRWVARVSRDHGGDTLAVRSRLIRVNEVAIPPLIPAGEPRLRSMRRPVKWRSPPQRSRRGDCLLDLLRQHPVRASAPRKSEDHDHGREQRRDLLLPRVSIPHHRQTLSRLLSS